MKKLFALAALAAVPALSSAQVSVGTPVVVNVGSVATAPQGLEIVADEVFGTGFTNQVVFKITDPLGAATPSTVADLSSTTTWSASRGPQDIDAIGTDLIVFGDSGTNGTCIITTIDSTNNTVGATINPAGIRTTGGIPLSATSFYAGEAASSTPEALDGTGASTSSAPLGPVGFRSPIRDAVVVGSSVFFLSGATDGVIPHSILEIAGVTAPDLATGTTANGFFASTGLGSRNHIGLATYNDGSVDWLVMPQSGAASGSGNGSIVFVDASNASNTVEVGTTELAGLQLTGIAVGQIGGNDYVAVASQNGGTNPNEVYIFEINPSANVQDWNMY